MDAVGVSVNVREVDRDQLFLMPLSVRDWLPDDHLAWFVLDVIAELDLDEFYGAHRGMGGVVRCMTRRWCWVC